MERPILLNASGAIVTRLPVYAHPTTAEVVAADEPLPIVPYVETVEWPVLSYDASAYLSGAPERMVTSTVSSGAALTFFCDGANGDDSGDGSPARPWRTLRHASSALACLECPIFGAGYDYVQLKVVGNAPDAFVSSDIWEPFMSDEHRLKLIVTGVGSGRVDLGGAQFRAGYFRHVRGIIGVLGGSDTTASDCSVVMISAFRTSALASPSVTIDCEFTAASRGSFAGDIVCDCSGAFTDVNRISARSCVYGGSFFWSGGSVSSTCGISCGEAYGVDVRCSRHSSDFIGLKVSQYAGNCRVEIALTADTASPRAFGIWATDIAAKVQSSTALVSLSAAVSGPMRSSSHVSETYSAYPCGVLGGVPGTLEIDGGRIEVNARITAQVSGGGEFKVIANAEAYGYSSAVTAHNCSVTADASAHAVPSADFGSARRITEVDRISIPPAEYYSSRWYSNEKNGENVTVYSGGTSLHYDSGVGVYSSWLDSSGVRVSSSSWTRYY